MAWRDDPVMLNRLDPEAPGWWSNWTSGSFKACLKDNIKWWGRNSRSIWKLIEVGIEIYWDTSHGRAEVMVPVVQKREREHWFKLRIDLICNLRLRYITVGRYICIYHWQRIIIALISSLMIIQGAFASSWSRGNSSRSFPTMMNSVRTIWHSAGMPWIKQWKLLWLWVRLC